MKEQINQANEYIKKHKHLVNPMYRHHYHLMGEIGWINDPNGFSIFQGVYHLFYQYHPYSSKWGPMHWGHAISTDLIQWTHLPIALAPLDPNKGADGGSAFSGSAIEINNKHYLMYTENWYYRQEQSVALSEDGVHYKRISEAPVLTAKDLPNGASTVDFRDPQIFKKEGSYYAIISSRAIDDSSQILLYQSNNLINWEYQDTVCSSKNQVGAMWECPDLFSLDGYDILLVSPQYMKPDGYQHNNIHASLYMVGKTDTDTHAFEYDSFQDVDSGFDFYAPQTVLDDKGRRIMIAWMGMWERNMPTDDLNHHWAGAMTLPRQLRIEHNKLIQEPIEELKQYRVNHQSFTTQVKERYRPDWSCKVSELQIEISNIDASSFGIYLFQGEQEKTILEYHVEEGVLVFDRSNSGYDIQGNTEYEPQAQVRKTKIPLEENTLYLHIFMDVSSIEVFIQHGKKAMTGLVYPAPDSTGISIFTVGGVAIFQVDKWNLEVTKDE
jgi:beta-fructofuranosidase